MLFFTNVLEAIQLADSTDKKRTWVQLLRPGKWKHSEYGTLKFDDKFFDSMVRNFDNNIRRIDLCVDAEHHPDEGAAGWIKKLENRGEKGLWALVEWTNRGVDYVKDKVYRYLSAEFDHSWKDEETGRKYKNVRFGAALTNRPFIKGMDPVNLSEYKDDLKNDDEITKLLHLTERITRALSDGDNTMKKCKKCGKEHEKLDENDVCSVCLAAHGGADETDEEKKKREETEAKKKKEQEAKDKLAETGEPARINQNPSGTASKSDEHDQAKKREEEEKKKNKGNVVAEGPKSVKQKEGKDGATVFEDEEGNIYVLQEDEKDDKKKKDDDKDKDKDKDDKKKKDEIELSEGVMIATKKFSERERATLVALSESEGKTRAVLTENLKVLREGRVESECRNIKEMLKEHFMDGKLTPVEKDMWEGILCVEAPQTDVAVYKLSEGEGDAKEEHFRPLVYIVNKLLSERPCVVELRELAHTETDTVRLNAEQKEAKEAADVGKRVAGRVNDPAVTERRRLAEKSST